VGAPLHCGSVDAHPNCALVFDFHTIHGLHGSFDLTRQVEPRRLLRLCGSGDGQS
jgi:hypothetical protein